MVVVMFMLQVNDVAERTCRFDAYVFSEIMCIRISNVNEWWR